MRILHTNIAFVQGGIDNMLAEIMHEQSQSGNEVGLLILNKDLNEKVIGRVSNEITKYLINRPIGSLNPWYIFKMIYLIKKYSPDVIHCHNAILGKVLYWCGVPVVLTVHDMGLTTKGYRYFDFICAISKSVYDDIKKKYKEDNVGVVYNGVDFRTIQFKPHYDKDYCRKFIVVSRLVHKKKGFDLLLESLSNLNLMGMKDWTLDFIGDGASRQFLEKRVSELNLSKQIFFRGEKNKTWINENLCEYDAFFMTSRYEGFGITILEAIGAGLEVLASNIDGPAEILQMGDYGHMFNAGDVDSLTNAIKLLYNIKSEGKKCTLENRKKIIEKYSICNTAEKYIEQYKKLIGNGDSKNHCRNRL